MRKSRKAEFGRYLGALDWSSLFSSLNSCEELEFVLRQAITTGLDIIMPLKRKRVNTNDAPWMTTDLKVLIIKCRMLFTSLALTLYNSNFTETLSIEKGNVAKQSSTSQSRRP